MRKIGLAITAGFALLLVGSTIQAQAAAPSASALAVANQLLELTKATDLAISSMDAMIVTQRQGNPRVPTVFWDRFAARVHESAPELASMLARVYASNYTEAELAQLLAFYRTPLGKRMVELQPAITAASMEAGRAWGTRIGTEIGQKLTEEGVMPPQ